MSNIVKETAKELGMTYKELAEEIGIAEGTLTNAASTGKISKQLEKSLELLKENVQYKKDFKTLQNFKELINK